MSCSGRRRNGNEGPYMRTKRGGRPRGRVRLIWGRWGGRILYFPSIDGLRPTLASQRETLFNWLRPVIANSRCLDLFAGSGALGFEAASGGADSVILVEKSKKAYLSLLSNAELLNAENCRIVNATAQSFLERYPDQFDIFFLDPPFSNPEILEKIDVCMNIYVCMGPIATVIDQLVHYIKWTSWSIPQLPGCPQVNNKQFKMFALRTTHIA